MKTKTSDKSLAEMTCGDCKQLRHDGICLNFDTIRKRSQLICSMFEEGRHDSRKDEKPNDLECIYTGRELIQDGIPEIKWRCRDLVPKGGVTFFGGTSGAFKTWNGIELALALVSGTHFMNEFNCPEKCKVLYIDEENGNVTIPARLGKLFKGRDMDIVNLDNLHFSIFNSIRLDNIESVRIFNDLIWQLMPDVVVVDSMVRAMSGEENQAKDVKQIFVTLKPHIEAGISFVILHHTVKNDIRSMAGLRGSGDFSAFADVVVMFSGGSDGYFNVNIVKNRHIELNELCEFYARLENLDDETAKIEYKGVHDQQGNVIERCMDDLKEWFQKLEKDVIRTHEIRKYAISQTHDKNRVNSAIKNFCENNFLIRLKQGKYQINRDILPRITEEFV